MSLKSGSSRPGANTSRPICCGEKSATPSAAAFSAVSATGAPRLMFRVRGSFTPRTERLIVVARAQVYGQSSPRRPVVLNEKPVAGHAEARGRAAEGLPKRVGVTAREVGQARKNVDSSKSVGH